jgi:periplasmic protein TonB
MKATENDSIKWDDIVFEQRNKAYGAYFIRGAYSKHVIIAVGLTILTIVTVLALPTIIEFFKGQGDTEEVALKNIKYTELAPPPPIDQDVPPPPKLDIPPPVKTIIKFLPPKVTEKEVAAEEEMQTIDEVKQNDIGSENIEGTGEVIFDQPVVDIVKEENTDDVIFTIVEQQAEYTGGFEALAKFLGKNIKYPAAPKRMGIQGTVYVGFVIERDGTISDIQVIKGVHADCDKEATRVVAMMPLWKPGKQNGKAVRSRFVLPVKFKLAE